jgi:hypothetical protein
MIWVSGFPHVNFGYHTRKTADVIRNAVYYLDLHQLS